MTQDTNTPILVGAWRKLTTDACAAIYPAIVTFAASVYRGTPATDQGMIWWDAGIYRLEDPNKLIISIATDELVSYDILISGDQFKFTDAAGCRVVYQRTESQG